MGKTRRELTESGAEAPKIAQDAAQPHTSPINGALPDIEKKKKKKKRKNSGLVDDLEQGTPAVKKAKKEKSHRKKDKDDKDGKKKQRKSELQEGIPAPVQAKSEHASDVNATAPAIVPVSGETVKEAKSSKKAKKDRIRKKKHRVSEQTKDPPEGGEVDSLPTVDLDGQRDSPTLQDGKLGLKVPRIEEIFARATKQRNTFLHGHSVVPLPSPEQLQALDEHTQHQVMMSTAELCERLMNLIHETIVTANQWTQSDRKDDVTPVEESLTNDIIRLKKVPLAKQYVEMTLWRRVVLLNRDQLQSASRLGFGKGSAVRGALPNQGLLLHRDDDPDAEFVSYREAHMKAILERYSDSLEKMRTAESMDADRVQFLLRCLDSGASLFGNLKCLERKEREGKD